MPTYNYICPNCQHVYSELRPADMEQIVKICNACSESEYIEQ
ncbi:hypothetical protein UFOVP694_57 [uncultured Caudovirales phage]|jgi:putative FmdB family regulatory protein|uniref:Uncharacterized protein n=1 Tax=uncultured Caudovirales phage TaxID=2100421 RepID=A0A6J5NDX3_9CAUD|nr:hypothetical protein UFOVP694_57 [uncultured Caudovirales phage]